MEVETRELAGLFANWKNAQSEQWLSQNARLNIRVHLRLPSPKIFVTDRDRDRVIRRRINQIGRYLYMFNVVFNVIHAYSILKTTFIWSPIN